VITSASIPLRNPDNKQLHNAASGVEFANFSFDVSEQQFESFANYNATGCFTNVVTTAKFISRIL
jgi:hypothetical protein